MIDFDVYATGTLNSKSISVTDSVDLSYLEMWEMSPQIKIVGAGKNALRQ